jgi:hypothetical protein
MKSIAKTALGLALVLAWWTLRGPGENTTATADEIPSVVWEGGGGSVTIRAETTTPARMRVHFSDEAADGESRSLETWEDVAAGSHSWTIAVPANVSGYLELGATAPNPGDRLRWSIEAGSSTVDEQDQTLEQPLEENHAFALQMCFDDLASGTLGEC